MKPITLISLALVAATTAFLAPPARTGSPSSSARSEVGHLLELRCLDELTRQYSFRDQCYGLVVHEREYRNRGCDVRFLGRDGDVLWVAGDGGATGQIVDLGIQRYQGTQGLAFPAWVLEGDRVSLDGSRTTGMGLTEHTFQAEDPDTAQAAVVLGHTYAVRLTRAPRSDAPVRDHYLLQVVEYTPGQAVTLRWRPL